MVTRSPSTSAPPQTDIVAGGACGAAGFGASLRFCTAMHGQIARSQYGSQRRVAVDLPVARLRPHLDRIRRIIEEDSLGRDHPYAELACLVSHGLLSVASRQLSVISCQ